MFSSSMVRARDGQYSGRQIPISKWSLHGLRMCATSVPLYPIDRVARQRREIEPNDTESINASESVLLRGAASPPMGTFLAAAVLSMVPGWGWLLFHRAEFQILRRKRVVSGPSVVFDDVWKKFRRGERHDSLRDLDSITGEEDVGRASVRGTWKLPTNSGRYEVCRSNGPRRRSACVPTARHSSC